MRRRRRAGSKPIDLFPFIAILACVIGVLTLLIAALSLGELDADTSGRDFVLLTRATAADRLEIDRLRRQGEDRRVRGARVRHARTELARLEAAAKDAAELQGGRDELAARVRRAEEQSNDLQRQNDAMKRHIDRLEDEVKALGDRVPARRKIELRGPKAREGQAGLKPRFVECRVAGFVLDADDPDRTRRVIPAQRIPTDSGLRSLLEEVRSTPGGIVILLVREGGVETHDQMVTFLQQAVVRHGALPVPSALDIDFSALKTSGK